MIIYKQSGLGKDCCSAIFDTVCTLTLLFALVLAICSGFNAICFCLTHPFLRVGIGFNDVLTMKTVTGTKVAPFVRLPWLLLANCLVCCVAPIVLTSYYNDILSFTVTTSAFLGNA